MKDRSFFKALIVDDEIHGRDQVAYHLGRHEDTQIIAAVGSVDEAMVVIRRDTPDIIFLDIDMPDKNGFELIREMDGIRPVPTIVFVTAYDQFAIKAIRASAFDYILKPIARDEFDEMVEKFRRKSSETDISEGLADLLTQFHKPEKLRFNQKGKTIFIDPDEIVYCRADGNYTEIFIDDTHKEVVSHHLRQVADLFIGDFQRLGRSLIINRKFLSKADRSRQLLEFRKHNQDFVLQVSPALIHKV